MDREAVVEKLLSFGLTRQEAIVYICLLREGKQTGYEAAKQTGISRSNAYGALANLIEKGAAYSEEETAAKKYLPVSLSEFCDNYIGGIERDKKWLLDHVVYNPIEEDGYITIEGAENILNKLRNLLEQTQERVYVSGSKKNLIEVMPDLERLAVDQKKVVIITDKPVSIEAAKVYITSDRGNQIGVIVDSKYVLTGDYNTGGSNTCLYSGQKNFVELYKNALSNEIKLIGYTKGEI